MLNAVVVRAVLHDRHDATPKAKATFQKAFKLGDAIVAPELGPLGAILGRALKAGIASTSLSATGNGFGCL